ncbi:inositol monophosphatase family protein [Bacteriovorax sp. DB6_IX]|uniref:inositol monophosphatase family protein n=1 Tax=Bacteriovorax sp. DB6_IX TaxID=1353530 RepID=UPI00038A34A2|nr:inositol monophosphatase family protein [Bacteriovorax sp. DB6_IX]EQC52391.1 inositol monophosphatase family protein [Bacteriovorax sp. DB6_IX]
MEKITKKELERIEADLISLSKKASRKILTYKNKVQELVIQSKQAQGIVSEADLASEEIITKYLNKHYPDIPVLAEESFFKEFKGKKDGYAKFKNIEKLWVIDPLDGTNNFVHGLDYFAVCISLVIKGKPVVGVVHCPMRKETFSASLGNGMKYNGRVIFNDKGRKDLKSVLLATGFATEKGKPFNKEFKTFKNMMAEVRAIRRMGSAALDLCFTALGIYDGFWERGLAPWDMAAATIICEEAGVKVTEYNGRKHNPFSETILAARKPIHGKLKKLLVD